MRDLSKIMTNLKKLDEKASNKTNSFTVEQEFHPQLVDGKFEAVIRFLPSSEKEDLPLPWLVNSIHFLRGSDGKFKAVDCLRRVGRECPICDYNRKMFAKYGKEGAKSHLLGKSSDRYLVNILVVRNNRAPETENQVFRFKFTRELYNKIMEEIRGDSMDEGVNVFDYAKGANMVYKLRSTEYGKSAKESYFLEPSPIARKDGTPLTREEIEDLESRILELRPYDKDLSKETYESITEKAESVLLKKLFSSESYDSEPSSYKKDRGEFHYGTSPIASCDEDFEKFLTL